MNYLSQPWPWYVAGPLIAFIMLSLLLVGKRFGLSSNLRSMCAMMGAGKHCDFFVFDWKAQKWNLVFVVGLFIGGWVSNNFLMNPDGIQLSEATLTELQTLGLSAPGENFVPIEVFTWDNLLTFRGLIAVVLGGFLVGFGARYAGGCTSGHAISGLSDLQIPSLIAVAGFFLGGLTVTYLIWPYILSF
ncbi:YeeE/YedE family protein [Ekhidna sp. To15]|uniref:YeeE/YedE family protein n=1 Tax=Ekhidna sp. To15 TaxID=3395267 RepID=UPI003F51CD3F